MADKDRVVFPDEVENVKAKVAEETKETTINTVEEPAATDVEPNVELRNMIQVPPNCPPGYKMGADGVCREIF